MIQFVFLLALATAKPIEDDGFAYKYFSHQPNFFYHSQPAVRFNTVAVPTQSFVSYKTSPSFYSTFGAVRRNNVAHVAAPVVNVQRNDFAHVSAPVVNVRTATRPVVSSLLTPVVKTTNHFVQVERKPQVAVKSFGLPPVQLTPIKVRDDSMEIDSVAFAQKQPAVAPAVVTYNAPTPVFRGINFPVVKPIERPTYYSHVTVSNDEDNSDEKDDETVTYYHSRDGQSPAVSVYSTNDDSDEIYDDDNQAFRYRSPRVASFRSAVSANPNAVVYRTDNDDISNEKDDVAYYHSRDGQFPAVSVYSTDDDSMEINDDDNQAFRYRSPRVASFRSAVSANPDAVVYRTDDDDNSDEKVDETGTYYHSRDRRSPKASVYSTNDDSDEIFDDDYMPYKSNSPRVASFRSAVSANPHAIVYRTDSYDNSDEK